MPWDNIDKIYEKISRSRFTTSCVNTVATLLIAIGVPENHTPDADDLIITATATAGTLLGYWYWLGRSHARRRRELQNDLNKVGSWKQNNKSSPLHNIGPKNCKRSGGEVVDTKVFRGSWESWWRQRDPHLDGWCFWHDALWSHECLP